MNTNFSKLAAYFGSGDTFTGKEPTVDDLIKALGDPSWQTRAEAVRKLGEVTTQSEQDTQRILELLQTHLEQDQVAAVRAASAEALGGKHELVAQQPLVRVLNDDEDDDVRTTAAQALKAWGTALSPQTTEELAMAYFGEESEYTRAAIITTLGESGPLVPFDVLEAALKDDSWLVRESAALSMSKQGLRANTEALEALLDDESEPVCKAAIYALTKILVAVSNSLPSIAVKDNSKPEDSSDENSSPSPPKEQAQDTSDDQEARRLVHGDVEFYAYEPGELEGTKVVAQALDNQWVPRSLLRSMLKGKITIKEAEKYLEGLVRTEYIRSLINGERVIINRAFLYNSAPLVRDYVQGGASREAFKKLLDQKVIVPWLLYELSPDEKPEFGVLPQSFPSWQQICEEVAMHCVRFSWDKNTNDIRQREFSRDFHEFVRNLYGKDLQKLALDLSLDLSSEDALFQRLDKVQQESDNYFKQHRKDVRPYITRNVLYQQFISATSNPAERVYDGTKPFSGEIKQLLDLFYNAHQADAFGGYLLTPIDSPTRQILQEWDPRNFQDNRQVGSATLIEMLRGSAFALVQEGLYLRSMGQLTLQDVLDIRDTEIWQKYIKSLQALLENPIGFSTLAQSVYYNYVELAKEMTHLIELRQSRQGGVLTAPWEPSAKVQIEVGAANLEVIWNKDGAFFKEPEEAERLLKTSAPSGTTPVTVRWTIGDSGTGSTSTQAKLYSSFEIMRGRMHKAQNEWQDLINALRTGLRYKEFSAPQEQKKEIPTVNERLNP
jgi:HEAT repeat protein